MIDSIKQKLEKLNLHEPTSYKKAGVFVGILYFDEYKNDPEILFTKRSNKVSTHSGETSFPGGKWEVGDKDLYHTSLRESFEEISLDVANVSKLGQLDYLISRHKIEVHPYVGLIESKQNLIPQVLTSLQSQQTLSSVLKFFVTVLLHNTDRMRLLV